MSRQSTRVRRRPPLHLLAPLLCVIDARLSILLIVLIQLNYAIATRIPFLQHLNPAPDQ
jgi:hypothetical protein